MSNPSVSPELTKYNIRSMKSSTAVTHMSRFAMFNKDVPVNKDFNAKKTLRKAANIVTAAQRFGEGKKGDKQELRADYVVITGHENGQLQIRNFDTGEVTGSGKHFNNLPVSCLHATNSYIYTAVDRDFRSTTASEETHNIYVWDMTVMCEAHIVLEGHTDRVTCLSVPTWNECSPVSGSIDKKLMIWDINVSKRPIRILDQHTMMIKKILLTREYIISGSSDQHINIWNWSGELKRGIEPGNGGGPIQYLEFSYPSSIEGSSLTAIISGCGAGSVREFIIEPNGQVSMPFQYRGAKGQIIDIASCSNIVISSTSESGYLSFYNRNSKALARFQLHESSIRKLEVDPRRKWVLSGTDEGLLSVFDYSNTEKLMEHPTQLLSIQGHRSSIKNVLLDYNNDASWDRIFSCAGDNSILVIDFDIQRGSRTSDLSGYSKPSNHSKQVKAWAVITQTGTLITISEFASHCDLWNTTLKQHKLEYSEQSGIIEVGNLSQNGKHISDVVYNEQDMKILVTSTDGFLHTFDVSLYDETGYGGEELIVKSSVFELRGPAECLSPCFNDIVGIGMSRTQHGTIEVLNYITGDDIFHFATATPPKRIDFIGRQEEGISQVVTQLLDNSVLIFDLSGKALATLVEPHGSGLRRVSLADSSVPPVIPHSSRGVAVDYIFWIDVGYSPPHALLITYSDRTVRETRIIISGGQDIGGVRNSFSTSLPSSVTCIEKMHQPGMHCVVGCANGNFYVLDKRGEVVATIMWDGGTVLGPLKNEEIPTRRRRESFTNGVGSPSAPPTSCVSCTLSGRYITCGFADGIVSMWDTTHRRITQRIFAHSSPILKARVLPQMMRIAAVSKTHMRIDDLRDRYDLLEGSH